MKASQAGIKKKGDWWVWRGLNFPLELRIRGSGGTSESRNRLTKLDTRREVTEIRSSLHFWPVNCRGIAVSIYSKYENWMWNCFVKSWKTPHNILIHLMLCFVQKLWSRLVCVLYCATYILYFDLQTHISWSGAFSVSKWLNSQLKPQSLHVLCV